MHRLSSRAALCRPLLPTLLAGLVAVLAPHRAAAAPGDLDPSFGDGGKGTTAVGSSTDWAYALVQQADGKLVAAGDSYNGSNDDFALVRLLNSSCGDGTTQAPEECDDGCSESCQTEAGFECLAAGEPCQDIDGCSGDPCLNGSTCVDTPAPGTGFACDCTGTGYSGTLCDTDVDKCAEELDNCSAAEDCVNTVGSFTCVPFTPTPTATPTETFTPSVTPTPTTTPTPPATPTATFTASPTAVDENACIPDTSNRLGWWTGDDTAADASGNGRDGTLRNGAGYTAGVSGSAFDFGGSNDFVEIADDDVWAFPGPFTVQLWVNPSSFSSTGVHSLIGQSEGVGEVNKWILWIGPNGNDLQFHINGPAPYPVAGYVIPGSFSFEANRWYHVAVTRDAGGTYRTWVDGNQVGFGSIAQPLPNVAGALRIGDDVEATITFNGAIDAVTIHDQALSASQLANIVAGRTCFDADHYVVYKIKASKQPDKSEKFPKDFNLTLEDVVLDPSDADNPENYKVKKEKSLALPAEKNDEAARLAPDLHYLRYQIGEAKEGIGAAVDGRFPKAAKHVARRWQLENQFGTITVDSKKVKALWLPTGMDETLPDPNDPGDRSHFVCYQVKAAKDVTTDQAPDGKFRKDIQAFFGDSFADCATFVDGTVAWEGLPAIEGKCLFDIRKPKELCNPAAKSAVTDGRETSAAIDGSVPTATESLLCYQAKLSSKILDATAAGLAGLATGDKAPKQAKHVKRKKKDGNEVFTTPGNIFPAPRAVDTNKVEMVCVPTEVLGVSALP